MNEETLDPIRQRYVKFVSQEELTFYLEELREQNGRDIEFEDLDIHRIVEIE